MVDLPRASRLRHPLVPLTSFVGRDQDIATLTALLTQPHLRLITLTGTGGIGKTRLALRVVEQLGETTGQETAWVSLATVQDLELVMPTIAQSLNLPDVAAGSLFEQIMAFLTERPLLLVLDNVEQVLEAAALLIANLLAHCPGLTVLTTSRVRLGISGEQILSVAPLDTETARALFAERAATVSPGFDIPPVMAPVIDAICSRLDRVPLAIELAAARTNVLPPPAMLVRLEHRFEVLTGGPRDAPDRHRAMRDTITWSYALLPEPEQDLFRRLAVFVGGFTLDAAEAVASSGTNVLNGISELVAASLVNPVAGLEGEPRFTMLEMVREYACEKLAASGEERTTRFAHAQHYLRLAEAAIPHYDGPELQTFRDRVEIELDNCRAAMASALDLEDDETGIRLAGALWRVWWYGHSAGTYSWQERVNEGRAWLERFLEHRTGLAVSALTEALTGAGILARLQSDFQTGERYGQELLSRSGAENDAYGNYWAHYMLGCTAEASGQTERAIASYRLAVATAPEIRNPENHGAMPRIQLGRIAERAGDFHMAASCLREALTLYGDAGNPHGVATASLHLGRVAGESGDLQEAATLLEDSLDGFKDCGDLGGVHASLAELARVAAKSGQVKRCARLFGAAAAFPGHPNDVAAYQDYIDETRTNLGEAAFMAASDQGALLAWDDVRSEVNALGAHLRGDDPEAGAPLILTARELEVLQLVATGYSNRAISNLLCLSERTVENHVHHTLNKLGVNSRVAAATWAVRHDLA